MNNTHIKSFINRQRHISNNSQKIFDDNKNKYVLNTKESISSTFIFSKKHLTVEIGFGNGNNLFTLASKYINQNFIGIEVYKPGIISLLSKLSSHHLENIQIYNEDAVIVLNKCFLNQSIDKIFIFFPDPWPKRKHHKRRLIQPSFIKSLQDKLKFTGIIHISTDCEDYAKNINDNFYQNGNFSQIAIEDILKDISINRPNETRFEKLCKHKSNQLFEIMWKKII